MRFKNPIRSFDLQIKLIYVLNIVNTLTVSERIAAVLDDPTQFRHARSLHRATPIDRLSQISSEIRTVHWIETDQHPTLAVSGYL
jgi:hypothetical protein